MSKRNVIPALTIVALLGGVLACDLSGGGGQDAGDPAPTTTPAVFATTTPGGMISVWLDASPQAPAAQGAAEGVEIVAPVGTATAAAAVALTATADAQPAAQATYQPGECPLPRNPQPPSRPQSFSQYASAIAQYLSAGGPTTLLEGAMRTWGAITDAGGLIKTDADVTGDGGIEVIITTLDPAYPDRQPQPGQLLIYGCDNGGYRLLYASTPDPFISLPVLLRVGDMNGDARAEVVYKVERCTQPDACIGEAQILTWDAALGSFRPLNAGVISAPNASFNINDVDEDGILELSVTSAAAGTGPQRTTTTIWDWDGQNYLMALAQTESAQYRIHAVHDADMSLAAGNFRDARDIYNSVLNDEALLAWPLPNERAYLNAYALYRLVLTYTLLNDETRALRVYEQLESQYVEGAPGSAFAALARAFWDEYGRTQNVSTSCAMARAATASRGEVLSVLNSYGTANRTYTAHDMCPY